MRARLPFLRLVLALCALLVTATALVAWLVRIDRVVVARGTLRGGSTAVRAPCDGVLRAVHAAPGQQLERDALLFELDDAQARAELARLEALERALDARRAGLQERLRARREAGLPQARERGELALERAQVERESAARRVDALENLRDEGLVAELAYQDALGERRSAELAVEQSRLAGTTEAGALESELAELAAGLEELAAERLALAAQVLEARRRVEGARVSAPCAGRLVGGAAADLAGRSVRAGEELARLTHGPAERFEGFVNDLGRAHVTADLPVRLRVDGYPWLLHGSVLGELERVDDVGEVGHGFAVEVALAGPTHGGPLLEGMQAEARILVEERVSLARLLVERLLGDGAP
jgi:multidrug resistance efflux pump